MSFAHQSGAGGVAVHGLLLGLDADDHAQYALADKTRPAPWVGGADLGALSLGDLGTRTHSLLTGLDVHDHTQYGRLAQSEVVSGSWRVQDGALFRFGHAAGPTIQGPAAGDDLTLTGDLALSGVLAAKGAPLDANYWLNLSPIGLSGSLFRGLNIAPTSLVLNANSASVIGVAGNPVASVGGAYTGIQMSGLDFSLLVGGNQPSAVVAALTSVKGQVGALGYGGTITTGRIFWGRVFSSSLVGASWSTLVGLDLEDVGRFANIVNAYGIRIADISLATGVRYLIEAGPATPNLRLLANAPPNAGLATEGDSQLLLAFMENAVVAQRRVRWRQQSSLLATDKVLIAA